MKIRDKKRKKELEIKRERRTSKEVSPSFKYLITLAYDGFDYGGYAKQKHKNTIQNGLESALNNCLGYQVKTVESSRTDAKVHALNQKVMFDSPTQISCAKLKNDLNNLLEKSIVIKKIETMKNNFHARYDVKDKTYEYTIIKDVDPRYNRYALYLDKAIDVTRMKKCCEPLLGEHDFSSFCSSKATSNSTIRIINYIDIIEDSKFIKIKINGSGFLYNMVRLIVYCMLEVGINNEFEDYLSKILNEKNKPEYIESVPANGLCLIEINY